MHGNAKKRGYKLRTVSSSLASAIRRDWSRRCSNSKVLGRNLVVVCLLGLRPLAFHLGAWTGKIVGSAAGWTRKEGAGGR